ncbi:MAG: 4-hydroxythreonine-4-phosphate dehydrogenase PdxA [Kiritimatiellia bacterium]|nr:4-hydroxythreonine-4-phosphate dehydrogenase PdxA [Kiritimatiellia bacterium]
MIPLPVGVTMGDPAGVGPELVAELLRRVPEEACVLYGSREVFRRAGVSERVRVVDIPFPEVDALVPGVATAAGGRVSERAVRRAAADALDHRIRAMVTAPICKEALHLAGCPLTAHTEILEACCGNRVKPSMVFWSPNLTVGLATIHIPLSKVPQSLTIDSLLQTIRRTAMVCGKAHPRVAVLGLNPHAGEHGLMGDEEQKVIRPAIARAREEGVGEVWLAVPDAAFAHQPLGFDCAVAMYHDQGLIPFKMLAFDCGVNVTAGLPLVRTSPDHGTAYDIAWKGKARVDSLLAAYRLAMRLSEPGAAL